MKTLKLSLLILFVHSIQSCSRAPVKTAYESSAGNIASREIASAGNASCQELASSILKGKDGAVESFVPVVQKNEQEVAVAVLKKNGLLKRKDKFLILEQPSVGWFNKVRKSAISHLQSWNKNRYPIFYTSDNENFVIIGKGIDDLLERKASGNLDAEDTKVLKQVYDQITMFENYESDLAKIIDERASLQYNLEVIKKMKLDTNPIDIKITIKKATGEESEVITFRKEDKNRKIVIDKLKKQLKELDGKLFKHGRIEERVIKQAFLKDILTIYHREVEYAFKNAQTPIPELEDLYKRLDKILTTSSMAPSTYGVFRMDHKLFKAELANFTKFDSAVRKVSSGKEKIKDSVQGFIGRKNKAEDDKNMGFLENIYVSVSNLTVADLTRYGIVGAIGFGTSQYLFIDSTEITNENDVPSVQDANGEVQDAPQFDRDEILQGETEDHTQQLQNTKNLHRSYLGSKYDDFQNKIQELFK